MSEHKNIVEETFSAAAEIQFVFNKAHYEEQESGAISPETQKQIDELKIHSESITSELGKWFLWVESELEGLKAKYKSIYEKMEADEAYLTNKLSFIEKCIRQILEPGLESILANDAAYMYYRENTRLEVEDAERIPFEFVETVTVPDQKAIKAALASGAEVPGCKLTKSFSLQIKHGGPGAIKNAEKLKKTRGKNEKEKDQDQEKD